MAISTLKLLLVAVLVQCIQLSSATYYCGAPDPLPYGTIRPQQRTYPVGATVEFSCNDGFVLVGQRWTVCVFSAKTRSADWAHPTPICKRITCPNLDNPRYGSVSVGGNTPGSRAEYSCNRGFVLVGVQWRKCQLSGQWTGEAPTCRPITCPDLDNPKYGSVRVTTNRVGGKADYSCNKGFVLVGVQWRKCQLSGQWTGEAPTCRPITCPDLDDPKYGSVRVTTNRVGGKADYSCNRGFVLVGVQWRKCQLSGQWTGKAPTCRRVVDCGKPPSVRYGWVKFSSTTEGSKATYSCKRGFFLRGNRVRVCRANRYWSGKTPVCVRKH